VDRDQKFNDALAGTAAYDVEHALCMYALDFCTLQAEMIYDKDAIASIASVANRCHVYIIGYTPRVEFVDAKKVNSDLFLSFDVAGKPHVITYQVPEGSSLVQDDGCHFLRDSSGTRFWLKDTEVLKGLRAVSTAASFEVMYVGQAYGKNGSRSAVDRLLKHETLQRIALVGPPKDHCITLLLLSIQSGNQLITAFNPFAKDSESGEQRIGQGLDKLFGTTEEERVSLYEAALIRYFNPHFNKEFKESFPSTNLKILRDCYDKDFSAVVAEICIDSLPYTLWSKSVLAQHYHIAKHDLHKAEDRKMFFEL
jgi:hypothetical protein